MLKKNRKRAWRRHYYQLQKKRAKRVHAWWIVQSDIDESIWGRWANTMKPCSCVMCGNPRKYYNELTMQERRAEYSYSEYMSEFI
jgi:hypothetical protein